MVFFTPYAGYSGSEISLISIIDNLKTRIRGITLVSDYPTEFNHSQLSGFDYRSYQTYLESRGLFLKLYHRLLYTPKKLYTSFLTNIPVTNKTWYINTIMMPAVLEFAEHQNISVILHVHEQYPVFKNLTECQVQRLISYPKLIIASSANCANVLRQLGCKLPIQIVYPGISIQEVQKPEKFNLKDSLGLLNETFIWGCVGNLDENKNPVLFIEIANAYLKSDPNSAFVWLGGYHSGWLYNYCKKLTEYYSIADKVFFIEHTRTNYYGIIQGFDGYVSTSRLESFGIVILEALSLGLPIVAYDSTGASEILTDPIFGEITKSTDPEVFVSLMQIEVFKNSENKNAKVEWASRFDISITFESWLKSINDLEIA